MKTRKTLTLGLAAFTALAWGGVASADAAAGKAKFDTVCGECHEAADFEGESAAGLTDSIKKIVAGSMKHKKALKLSDAEIADLAAFMSTGK